MTMNTSALKKFAQEARRQLLDQVAARMEQVLSTDSVEIREKEKAVKELREQIRSSSKETVIDQVAYTWFNRFCALRYMDANQYTRIGIVSPVEGFTQPEILQEAKQGVIDDSFKVDKQKVVGLLNGQLPSSNPKHEAYRLLLVGACNAYHTQMPFLFPKIEDYTELLMPDDLLSENSILHAVRSALDEDACQDVEVIGWLYQYYISERKDEVFAALKKNKKIEADDIPAATQLFTPHWIVGYLLENSLGRLWMLNHPQSKLVEQMDYYIKPEEAESDYLEISSPEEIKVCDPACGSGHMLTYAFDLLYTIYEEQGYDPVQIPTLILNKNLYGIEIDKRAGDLAAFALMMKAREKDSRFFSRSVEPNICVLQNITFTPSELDAYRKKVGHDLFTQDLWVLLQQFEQADNFGSLIRPQVQHPEQILERLEELGAFDDLLLYSTNENVKRVLKQAEYLIPRYHVVVANPPYMGRNNMNVDLRNFAKMQYPDTKIDLGVMFIERNFDLVKTSGIVGMITMQSWMFLSSYEKFRDKFLNHRTINSMCHLGTNAFDTISGEVVSTTSFSITNFCNPELYSIYLRLIDGNNEAEKEKLFLENIPKDNGRLPNLCFRSSSTDFKKIPGVPIAYWVSDKFIDIFEKSMPLAKVMMPRKGIATGNNNRFLRLWYEVEKIKLAYPENVFKTPKKWYAITKGGGFRKWYGNHDYLVNWENDGYEIKNYKNPDGSIKSRPQNTDYFFKGGITWSDIASSQYAFRKFPKGFAFEGRGPAGFFERKDFIEPVLGFLNSKIVSSTIRFVNPTLSLNVGEIAKLPFLQSYPNISDVKDNVVKCIQISKEDWNLYENSWDFTGSPLLQSKYFQPSMQDTFVSLKVDWDEKILEMQCREEENNMILIEIYDLKNELIPDVPLGEITLSSNPDYRYPNKQKKILANNEREAMFLEDTMKEFISYAVGCMLGRYSLDKPGVILANAGETIQDYLEQVPEPSFAPDNDNVIPLLEGEWFEDDIAERFKDFLKITFGIENFDENLAFLEGAIGRDIRSYFVTDFYKEHVKMYKKRPIYWLFSSPNGSFNALVYMHRYRQDTMSVILNDYLLQYREKLAAHKALLETRSISASASQGEKTKALNEIDKINKILSELKEYEDEILYPLATQQIEIDLDDGVKVNYNKFGKALNKVKGLNS